MNKYPTYVETEYLSFAPRVDDSEKEHRLHDDDADYSGILGVSRKLSTIRSVHLSSTSKRTFTSKLNS